MKNLNDNFLDPPYSLKYNSISDEIKNSLSVIKSSCETIKNNLNQIMESLDLISTSSSRSLEIIDIIKHKEINKKIFVHILISTIIEAAIREYAFKNDEGKKLVSVDLKNDFDFYGNETLMILAVQKLLKNSLKTKANKIHIRLDGDNRCLYFMDNQTAKRSINLTFFKKIMKSFGGNVSYELNEERGIQFCFKFSESNSDRN